MSDPKAEVLKAFPSARAVRSRYAGSYYEWLIHVNWGESQENAIGGGGTEELAWANAWVHTSRTMSAMTPEVTP